MKLLLPLSLLFGLGSCGAPAGVQYFGSSSGHGIATIHVSPDHRSAERCVQITTKKGKVVSCTDIWVGPGKKLHLTQAQLRAYERKIRRFMHQHPHAPLPPPPASP